MWDPQFSETALSAFWTWVMTHGYIMGRQPCLPAQAPRQEEAEASCIHAGRFIRTLTGAVAELGAAEMEEGAGGDGCGGGGDRSTFVIGLIENRAKEVGVAAFDLRSASLHLSQYIETSCSYHNTKTLLHFYDPMVIIVPPNKTAADGMVGVSELVGKHYPGNKKTAMAHGCFDDTKIEIHLPLV